MAEPHQGVEVDEGVAQASIQTADGRSTLISVRPDGSISRTQTFTDDRGREVALSDVP
jgi:hypothetical protein